MAHTQKIHIKYYKCVKLQVVPYMLKIYICQFYEGDKIYSFGFGIIFGNILNHLE